MQSEKQKKNLNPINIWWDYPLASKQHQFLHLSTCTKSEIL